VPSAISALLLSAAALAAVVAAVCAEATAQTIRTAPGAMADGSLDRQWALRGVIVSGSRRAAVLEHLASGRQELVALGAAVTPSVSLVEIEGEQVVLKGEGGATTALRLGHGGQPVVRRPPPRRFTPPAARRR
jgi:hypothetical protein